MLWIFSSWVSFWCSSLKNFWATIGDHKYNNKFWCSILKLSQLQYDYRYSMSIWSHAFAALRLVCWLFVEVLRKAFDSCNKQKWAFLNYWPELPPIVYAYVLNFLHTVVCMLKVFQCKRKYRLIGSEWIQHVCHLLWPVLCHCHSTGDLMACP